MGYRTDSALRRQYLAITQPGIGLEAAVTLIKKQIHPEGALQVRHHVPCLEREEAALRKGAHSIKVNLGWYYWGVTRAERIGEWCFNDHDHLIDIIIYTSVDDVRASADVSRD
jgi:hypothetical protein